MILLIRWKKEKKEKIVKIKLKKVSHKRNEKKKKKIMNNFSFFFLVVRKVHKYYMCNTYCAIIFIYVYFNLGGLQKTELIRRDLIDASIPFLPLEKSHVKLCIRSDRRKFSKRRGEISQIKMFNTNLLTNKLYNMNFRLIV